MINKFHIHGIMLILIISLAGCRDSSVLDTPRTLEPMETTIEYVVTWQVDMNGNQHNMKLLSNRFQLSVTGGKEKQIQTRSELQNLQNDDVFRINSIYFRCRVIADSMPHSISGTPEDNTMENAARIIFYVPGSGLVSVVPQRIMGPEDNMMISFSGPDSDNVIHGTLVYRGYVPGSPDSARITGKVTIQMPQN